MIGHINKTTNSWWVFKPSKKKKPTVKQLRKMFAKFEKTNDGHTDYLIWNGQVFKVKKKSLEGK